VLFPVPMNAAILEIQSPELMRTPATNTRRIETTTTVFGEQLGGEPTVWCRAPGRVDLMGGHTDYNLGYVLTLPIDRDTWIAARPREDRAVRLYSLNLKAASSFELDRISRTPGGDWSNYVRGVASVLQATGFALKGFDAVVQSTVPMSSGLSSSAALECATATVFEAVSGFVLDPIEKARLCQRAENQFVGVNCGILDQYTSCCGQAGCALLLDCRDLSSQATPLAEGIHVVICDTKFKRELAGSEYGRRRAQCEEGARLLGLRSLREISVERYYAREKELPAEVAKRCRFIVEENDRVPQMAKALTAGDEAAVRALTATSFKGACELYEVSVPAMIALMEAMLKAPGVIGARQAGAGFGGCMAAIVRADAVEAFSQSVRQAYHAQTGIAPEVYAVEPAAGAGTLRPAPGARRFTGRDAR
jgi:galactokinase